MVLDATADSHTQIQPGISCTQTRPLVQVPQGSNSKKRKADADIPGAPGSQLAKGRRAGEAFPCLMMHKLYLCVPGADQASSTLQSVNDRFSPRCS